jgi:hypothetical protein
LRAQVATRKRSGCPHRGTGQLDHAPLCPEKRCADRQVGLPASDAGGVGGGGGWASPPSKAPPRASGAPALLRPTRVVLRHSLALECAGLAGNSGGAGLPRELRD